MCSTQHDDASQVPAKPLPVPKKKTKEIETEIVAESLSSSASSSASASTTLSSVPSPAVSSSPASSVHSNTPEQSKHSNTPPILKSVPTSAEPAEEKPKKVYKKMPVHNTSNKIELSQEINSFALFYGDMPQNPAINERR